MMDFQRESIWNVRVQTVQLSDILNAIDDGISKGINGITLCCANPHSLVAAKHDQQFLTALCAADFLIPDGAGIVLASKLLGGTITRRITGSDVLTGMAERWERGQGGSFFFLGSSDEVLRQMKTRMSNDYPHVSVCGTYAPPFKQKFSDDENNRMIENINLAAPTALWVGMTAPKQEKWVHEHRSRLNVPFIAAVGAAFDYFAGTKRRASTSLQRAGLEWLPRLLQEPRRMWRRNLISTPVFLYYIFRQKLLLAQSRTSRQSMRT
jgi:N-acetylglucosaminyldiphosphoundecaprenol N-acetyl-beta-D-mannosaminyltransferase